MRHCRDKVSPAALQPHALLGAPDGDHYPADRAGNPVLPGGPAARLAHVGNADQQLGPVGQEQLGERFGVVRGPGCLGGGRSTSPAESAGYVALAVNP